ncbi:Digestive cathepsin D CatD1 [Aphelenchoides bicaudatus]|nr:Digestive cathepsin D CatD1 [Aphelenchoides bicaudatus]
MKVSHFLLLVCGFCGFKCEVNGEDKPNTVDVVHYPLRVQKHFYTSIFYIGTPPKRFELAFDITSAVLWVYDNDEQSSTEGPASGSAEGSGVQIYKASQSNTSEFVGDIASSNMLLETIDLDLYRDLVVHENQSLGRLLFGTIEYDPQLNLYVPFDGIFGIDRFLLDNMTTWPQGEMLHSGSKVFTLYTPHIHEENSNQTIEISPIDAMLTVGEPKVLPNCAKEWTRLPMTVINSSHGFFDFKLNRSQFGDQNVAYPSNAVFSFSTLTSYITVDSRYFALLKQQLGVRNETTRFGRPKLFVNCSRIKDAPSIEFFGQNGERFVVPPTSYIRRCGFSGRCVLRVRENLADFRNRWVLGSPFFYEYCIQFRYDNNTVGIAEAVHKSEELKPEPLRFMFPKSSS